MEMKQKKLENCPFFAWHARGHGFDSHILHKAESLTSTRLQPKNTSEKEPQMIPATTKIATTLAAKRYQNASFFTLKTPLK